MSYQQVQVTIVGVAPLLLHNAQLADPLNKFVRGIKEITAKGKRKPMRTLKLSPSSNSWAGCTLTVRENLPSLVNQSRA